MQDTYGVYDEFSADLVQRQENGDLLVTVWRPYDERAKKIYEKNKY